MRVSISFDLDPSEYGEGNDTPEQLIREMLDGETDWPFDGNPTLVPAKQPVDLALEVE